MTELRIVNNVLHEVRHVDDLSPAHWGQWCKAFLVLNSVNYAYLLGVRNLESCIPKNLIGPLSKVLSGYRLEFSVQSVQAPVIKLMTIKICICTLWLFHTCVIHLHKYSKLENSLTAHVLSMCLNWTTLKRFTQLVWTRIKLLNELVHLQFSTSQLVRFVIFEQRSFTTLATGDSFWLCSRRMSCSCKNFP